MAAMSVGKYGSLSDVFNDTRIGSAFGSHVRLAFTENPTDYTGELVRLLSDLSMATRMISAGVRRAGLPKLNRPSEILSSEFQSAAPESVRDPRNFARNKPVMTASQFDAQSATDVLYKSLSHDGHTCIMLSMTCADALSLPDHVPYGNYVLAFSPLERDPMFPEYSICGTIFSVYKRTSATGQRGTTNDFLRPGTDQVAAGYVLYGNCTTLVYTVGQGVHAFNMHPNIKEFFHYPLPVKIKSGKFCFVNRQHSGEWKGKMRAVVDHFHDQGFSIQYTSSLVADVQHHLSCGGIIICAATTLAPDGPMELLCQAAPLAFLMEQAGGKASDGSRRILDIKATSLHAKTTLIIGTPAYVDVAEKILAASTDAD